MPPVIDDVEEPPRREGPARFNERGLPGGRGQMTEVVNGYDGIESWLCPGQSAAVGVNEIHARSRVVTPLCAFEHEWRKVDAGEAGFRKRFCEHFQRSSGATAEFEDVLGPLAPHDISEPLQD